MKKLFCILLTAVLVLGAAPALADEWTCPSCGNAASGNFCNNCGAPRPEDAAAPQEEEKETPAETNETPEAETESASATGTAAATDENGYAVTKEYSWSTDWGHYYAMVIKNISGAVCSYDIQTVFYDASNNMVGVSNSSVAVCDDGYEVLVQTNCDTAFDHVEYVIEQGSSRFNDIHSYVTVTAEMEGDKAILKAVNTGTVDADYVEYHSLYLNDQGEVSASGWGFLTDNDGQLKSGKTELREESSTKGFDSVLVYFEGRTESSVVSTGTVEAEDISISAAEGCEITHEYVWSTSWFNNYALVIKNTTGETCGYTGRFIFYDADNHITGVSNPDIAVLGNGYEALFINSQDRVFDHVSYCIQPKWTSLEDVHDFVEITASISGNKAILAAKNNGMKTAKYIEFRCLFLDKDGNAAGSDWGYLIDDDSELKPGKTELREATCYDAFDSVIVYFEGRC